MKRLLRDRRAASSIEYSLLASLIAVAIIVAVGSLGSQTAGLFDRVVAGFAAAR
jgi:Flp pilus assembly pilin Flp